MTAAPALPTVLVTLGSAVLAAGVTAVLGGATWLGSVAGADLTHALAATLLLMLASGYVGTAAALRAKAAPLLRNA